MTGEPHPTSPMPDAPQDRPAGGLSETWTHGPGRDRQPADPGSPMSRRVAVLLAVASFLVVAAIQNVPPVFEMFGIEPFWPTSRAAETPEDETPTIDPPAGVANPIDLVSQLGVGIHALDSSQPDAFAPLLQQLDSTATSDVERLRVAIVAGEVVGPQEAIDRLTRILEATPDEEDDVAALVREDARTLIELFEWPADGISAEPDDPLGAQLPIDETTRQRLLDHHGFYAEIVLSRGLPESDPRLQERRAKAIGLTVVMVAFGGLVALVALGALVCFIAAIVMAATGQFKPRMPLPEAGGSVYMETFGLFVLGFLLLQLVGNLLPNTMPWPYIKLGSQWLLALVPLWPLARGMGWQRLTGTVGLHRGRGLLAEVGAGIFGYLAGFPVFLFGVAITFVLLGIASAFMPPDSPPPTNPVIELVESGDAIALALVFSLAVFWAPLTEELVFRGALFRHFTGTQPVVLAALASATLFGFMHGYGPLFVFPLIALGFNFALMRRWRGSIIAPITAHFLHNGTILTIVILLVSFAA